MRHRIPISKANLHWNHVFKTISIVDYSFNPFDSVKIGEIEIVNGKLRSEDLKTIAGLYDNPWGITEKNIEEFVIVYKSLIPALTFFESIDI
jgi:hypothetical protein